MVGSNARPLKGARFRKLTASLDGLRKKAFSEQRVRPQRLEAADKTMQYRSGEPLRHPKSEGSVSLSGSFLAHIPLHRMLH